MSTIRGFDALGAGLVVVGDAFGNAAPLFPTALTGEQILKTDWDDGTQLYRFYLSGFSPIVAASVVTRETATSVEILQATYENANGAPLIALTDIAVTYETDALPSPVPIDQSPAFDFVTNGTVSLLGDDLLIGAGFDDYLMGLQGQDRLFGFGGDDMLFGGEDDDLLRGGAGADLMDGGSGIDTASYTGSAIGLTISLANGALNTGEAAGDVLTSIEVIAATRFADIVQGSDQGDTIYGGDGDDMLLGLGGDDLIKGGAGDDMLWGNAGIDILIGGAGSDQMDGGTGNDRFFIDAVDTLVDGGAGTDTVDFSTSATGISFAIADTQLTDVEIILGSAQADDIAYQDVEDGYRVQAGAGDDRINAGLGDDVILGEDGDDVITSQGGNSRVYGGAGDDQISFSSDFSAGAYSVEAYGGAGDDSFFISNNHGGLLSGGTGDDFFRLLTLGNCDMQGGAGEDEFVFLAGEATVSGGDGQDRFSFYENYTTYFDVTLTDWQNETLVLDIFLFYWDYPDPFPQVADLERFTNVQNGNLVFTLDGSLYSSTLTLEGVTDFAQVADFIEIYD